MRIITRFLFVKLYFSNWKGKSSLPLKRQDINDLMICDRLLSFRDTKLLTSQGRLQNPTWAVISCHWHTCNCWPFSSCVMKSDGRLLEARVTIMLASLGKNVGWTVPTIWMLHFLVTRSFLLVSSDSASIGRETKQCSATHLFHAKAMQKDQHEVHHVLHPAQKCSEVWQEELHSLQHTSDT